jgi:hypothetical protein
MRRLSTNIRTFRDLSNDAIYWDAKQRQICISYLFILTVHRRRPERPSLERPSYERLTIAKTKVIGDKIKDFFHDNGSQYL